MHCHSSEQDDDSCPDLSLNGLGGITLVFLIISDYWVGHVIKVRQDVLSFSGRWLLLLAIRWSPEPWPPGGSNRSLLLRRYVVVRPPFPVLSTVLAVWLSCTRWNRRLSVLLVSTLECGGIFQKK